jgi:pyruvate formate lyase activating enzyme
MALMGLVFDIRKFSIHDGPGIRTTVFFKGCSLNCWWCHNPESQSLKTEFIFREDRCIHCETCVEVCSQNALSLQNGIMYFDEGKCNFCAECVSNCYADAREIVGKMMSADDVIIELEKDRAFYDQSGGGITISGGEPLVQADFLFELVKACKARDLHVALDTSGYASWNTFEKVCPYVDLFLYDLKLIPNELHRKFTGVSNRLILENLEKLSEKDHHIMIRVPIIPGITDTYENIKEIGLFASRLKGIDRIDILPYHKAAVAKYERSGKKYKLPDLEAPSESRMNEIAEQLSSYGLSVHRGG